MAWIGSSKKEVPGVSSSDDVADDGVPSSAGKRRKEPERPSPGS